MNERTEHETVSGEPATMGLVVDIGMHIGQDTAYYLAKGFSVLAVEADPALVSKATDRFAGAIASGTLEIIHAAVAESDGETILHRNTSDPLYNTIDASRLGDQKASFNPITVPAIAPATLLKRADGARYIKVDIEGADDLVLQALINHPDLRPPYISAEVNGPEQAALLYAAGYRGFKLINQARYTRWQHPDPPREGGYTDHVFELHSSGPFGEESSGAWVSFKEFIKQWNAAARLMSLNTDVFDAWFDVHAQLDTPDD